MNLAKIATFPTVEQNNAAFQAANPQYFVPRYSTPAPAVKPAAAPVVPVPAAATLPVPTSGTTIRTPDAYQQSLDDAAATAASRESLLRQNQAYAATQRQARIDAINQTFAPRVKREEDAGAARLARVDALNFKSGIVGSGVDTTKTGEQKGLSEAAMKALEQEKALMINDAFNASEKLARDLTDDAYTAATKSAEANVAASKNRLDSALNILKTFGSSGKINSSADLQKTDPASYNTLKTASSMTDAEIDTYLKVNAPKGTYEWSQAQVKGSTMYVPTMKNGKPGVEAIDLGFTPDKVIKTTVETDQGVEIIFTDGTYKTIGAPKTTTGFTLNPGETRYDAKGNPIVTAPTSSTSIGKLTPADEAKGVNYLLQNGGTAADLDKFKTDRAYQAWVMGKLE